MLSDLEKLFFHQLSDGDTSIVMTEVIDHNNQRYIYLGYAESTSNILKGFQPIFLLTPAPDFWRKWKPLLISIFDNE